MDPSENLTALLVAWRNGDDGAFEKLVPLVERELNRIAKGYMARERIGHSLQATALVNEAYLRLIDARQIDWQHRAHFLAIAARLMRRILVDHARSQRYLKRGGGALKVTFDEALPVADGRSLDVVALHEALEALALIDGRKSQVVELRFFGGFSVADTAALLDVSAETVMRDWKFAKAWLTREMRGAGG